MHDFSPIIIKNQKKNKTDSTTDLIELDYRFFFLSNCYANGGEGKYGSLRAK